MNCHPTVVTDDLAARLIVKRRAAITPKRCVLVGISGIDGSGKGYITTRVADHLQKRGLCVAMINIDGWLQLPAKRFDPLRPAEHFLEMGFRFDEMFKHLVLPLRENRSIDFVADLADAGNTPHYVTHRYAFSDVDVILLEGTFLFKREFVRHYDLRFWIECTFETALDRALARGQEGLPPDEVIPDYQTIYFPAERLHMAHDDPRGAGTAVIVNDHRMTSCIESSSVAQKSTLS